jgi:hypothetical protein
MIAAWILADTHEFERMSASVSSAKPRLSAVRQAPAGLRIVRERKAA